jgi:hypothetical protein
MTRKKSEKECKAEQRRNKKKEVRLAIDLILSTVS